MISPVSESSGEEESDDSDSSEDEGTRHKASNQTKVRKQSPFQPSVGYE